MAITVTKQSTGLLFDFTTEVGAGTIKPKYVFRPSLFHTIIQTKVFDNRFEYTTVDNRDYIFSFDGTTPNTTMLSHVQGVACISNEDLFTKFNSIL